MGLLQQPSLIETAKTELARCEQRVQQQKELIALLEKNPEVDRIFQLMRSL